MCDICTTTHRTPYYWQTSCHTLNRKSGQSLASKTPTASLEHKIVLVELVAWSVWLHTFPQPILSSLIGGAIRPSQILISPNACGCNNWCPSYILIHHLNAQRHQYLIRAPFPSLSLYVAAFPLLVGDAGAEMNYIAISQEDSWMELEFTGMSNYDAMEFSVWQAARKLAIWRALGRSVNQS